MLANTAGQWPASGVPSPSKAKGQVWPDADVSVVAFRFHALGGTERATRAMLDHLAAAGVRNVKAYCAGISDDELTAYLNNAEPARVAAVGAAGGVRSRGDLMTVRTPVRWPWATTSSGGGRGA